MLIEGIDQDGLMMDHMQDIGIGGGKDMGGGCHRNIQWGAADRNFNPELLLLLMLLLLLVYRHRWPVRALRSVSGR